MTDPYWASIAAGIERSRDLELKRDAAKQEWCDVMARRQRERKQKKRRR